MISAEIIKSLAPRARPDYTEALIHGGPLFEKYGITTPMRMAAFLGTVLHETGNLTILRESLNYTTASRIAAVWPTRFTTASAAAYVRNEKKLANTVYGGRMGNERNGTNDDDGYRYRGASFLQTTGYDNFKRIGDAIGVDLGGRPELIEDANVGLEAALYEFKSCLQYCDMGERGWKAVCNAINRGAPNSKLDPIGWLDRQRQYQRCCDALGISGKVVDDLLRLGDRGSLVQALQTRLAALGYAVGRIDGIYGSRMRAAVAAFQLENDLSSDGIIGPKTRAALNSESAVPMPVGERGTETAADLKAAGSEIISGAQSIKNGAKAVGGIGLALGGAQQADMMPTFDPIATSKEVVTEIGSWKVIVNAITETFGWVTSHWYIFAIVAAFAFYRWGSKIELRRVLDHQSGAHVGR